MDHMTAKVSCFARAYHYRNNTTWIFNRETYKSIADVTTLNEVEEYIQTMLERP